MEHIAVTEQLILGGIKKSLSAPADPARFNKSRDEVILQRMPDRSSKAQAGNEIRPTGRPEFATPSAAIEAFNKTRAASVEFVRESGDGLRSHGFKHFAFGELDAYQWSLLLSGHAERHTKQIDEVKASSGYPL